MLSATVFPPDRKLLGMRDTTQPLIPDEQLAEYANQPGAEYAEVGFESPSPTEGGFDTEHGWVLTGTFLNTDVPAVVIVRSERMLKVALDRVVYIDSMPAPERSPDEQPTGTGMPSVDTGRPQSASRPEDDR